MFIAIWKKKEICQMQITDYFGNFRVIFFDMSDSNDRRLYELLLNGAGIKKRKKRAKPSRVPKEQTLLDFYFEFLPKYELKWSKMPYRQKVDYPEIPAPFRNSLECIALQNYSTARGYLKHIFQLNSLKFWEDVNLNDKQKHLYRSLSIVDVFKLEMARYKLGINKYKDWIDFLKFTPAVIDAVEISYNVIPAPSEYGQLVFHLGSENIKNYFLERVKECISYKLIDCKIITWDGRFLESYCAKNENKTLKAFADPEAGKYKHVGKFRGLGYVDSSIVCAKYNLPIYYDSFPANRNDNPIFRETFGAYSTLNFPRSQILLADAGPYSIKSLKLVKSFGIIPLIYARKNIKLHVIKVDTRKYINISYIPASIITYLRTLLNIRTGIERSFAPARVVYNASRMNNRGMENSKINIGKLKCIELLTAIKVRRLDLTNIPTAFSDFRGAYSVKALKIPQFEKFNSILNGAKIEAYT